MTTKINKNVYIYASKRESIDLNKDFNFMVDLDRKRPFVIYDIDNKEEYLRPMLEQGYTIYTYYPHDAELRYFNSFADMSDYVISLLPDELYKIDTNKNIKEKI